VIFAVIEGWTEQWYGYDPALLNVKVNVAPGATDGLWNAPLSLVTVWATLSLLVHVTVSPTLTVRSAGANAKFAIETAGAPPAAGAELELPPDDAGGVVAAGVELEQPTSARTTNASAMMPISESTLFMLASKEHGIVETHLMHCTIPVIGGTTHGVDPERA
jgi:hypothetical protein